MLCGKSQSLADLIDLNDSYVQLRDVCRTARDTGTRDTGTHSACHACLSVRPSARPHQRAFTGAIVTTNVSFVTSSQLDATHVLLFQ